MQFITVYTIMTCLGRGLPSPSASSYYLKWHAVLCYFSAQCPFCGVSSMFLVLGPMHKENRTALKLITAFSGRFSS